MKEVVPILNATYEVFSSSSSMCRTTDKSKEFTETSSYSETKFQSSIDIPLGEHKSSILSYNAYPNASYHEKHPCNAISSYP
ncbi:hypothetical protein H5410_051081 [Solanum commersonii]|uniref:Uncharacterized protein n=1 Tax=Solanum commersonii TaxID=4109 RepID=A0A9J5WZN5_SOLCO|nr:hypothetical protein H5410_051081 [Solanum commersonii]